MNSSKFIITIFILLLLSNSCVVNKKNYDITGTYKCKTYSYFKRVVLYWQKKTYSVNTNLIIQADSTYVYTTCGNIINGKWKIKNDSLFLYCLDNNFLNDSINKIRKPSCGDKPVKFYIDIENNELKDEFYMKNMLVLDYLKKVN